jgi:UDP-glucose 4-epimerase
LVHAVINDVPGVYNVAAEDTLPLNKIRGLAGKSLFSVFPRIAKKGMSVANRLGLRTGRYAPIELDYIRYPWVGDLTRMREGLGFTPRYTAEETLREFADQRRGRSYLPDSPRAARDEERLRQTIEQRRQARVQRIAATPGAEEGGDDE